jgi:hypothetical protein
MSYEEEDTCMSYEEEDTCLRGGASPPHAMDSQTVFGCDNAVHAYFNLYAAYMVCKWMCVFVFVCVSVCVCVCV